MVPSGSNSSAYTFPPPAALVDAQVKNWETGLFFCGSNIVKVNKVERVADIIAELFEEFVGRVAESENPPLAVRD